MPSLTLKWSSMPMPPKASRERWTRSASMLTAAAARRWCTTSFTQTESCLPFAVLWKGAVECPSRWPGRRFDEPGRWNPEPSAGRHDAAGPLRWAACGETPVRRHLADERLAESVRQCQQSGDEGRRRSGVTEKHTVGCQPNRPLAVADKWGNSASAAQITAGQTQAERSGLPAASWVHPEYCGASRTIAALSLPVAHDPSHGEALLVLKRRVRHDFFLGRLRVGNLADQMPLPHHDNAVGDCQHLGQVARNDEDRQPLRRELAHQGVDLGL